MGSQGRSPRQGLGAVAPVKSPFPGERGQGDRGSELEVCFKNILFLQTESHSKSCGFHIVAKLKHRNGEMRAAVILKRTKRNFWFLFLTFITAGNESKAKLNQIERRI